MVKLMKKYIKSTLEEYNKNRDEYTGSTQDYLRSKNNKILYRCSFCKNYLQKKDIEWYFFNTEVRVFRNGTAKMYPHKKFLMFCDETHFNLYVLATL